MYRHRFQRQGEWGVCVILNQGEGGKSLRLQMKREAIHMNMKRVNGKQMFSGPHRNNGT